MVLEITADNRRLIEAAIAAAAAITEQNPEAGVTWKDLMPADFREKLAVASPPRTTADAAAAPDDEEFDEVAAANEAA